MKKKFLGRVLTMLLVASMVFTLLPAPAIAAGNWWWNNDEYTEEAVPTATADANYHYNIFFLDCGRKYYSVESIKQLIDNASAAGFNYIQLAVGNDGLRFLLDDMSLEVNGTTYTDTDVRDAVQAGNLAYNKAVSASYTLKDGQYRYEYPYSPTVNELTQSEMDGIIAYAKEKSMGVIPCVNTPGHMDAILSAATSLTKTTCSYNGSARTIDVTNTTATAFTQALLQKYITYFAGMGCQLFNMGADEYANDVYTGGGMGFGNLQSSRKYGLFVNYINAVAKLIEDAGMTPMAFNDGIYYGGDKSTKINENIVICYWSSGWSGYDVRSAKDLANDGFAMVNTNGAYYYVLGKDDKYSYLSNDNTIPFRSNAETLAQGFVTTEFAGKDAVVANPVGSMLCVWSDFPGAETEETVVSQSAGVIRGFGSKLPTLTTTTPTPPDGGTTPPETITVPVNGTKEITVDGNVTVTTDGDYNASIATYESNQTTETTTTETPVTSPVGKSFYIRNVSGTTGTMYLGDGASWQADVSNAKKWICRDYSYFGSTYYYLELDGASQKTYLRYLDGGQWSVTTSSSNRTLFNFDSTSTTFKTAVNLWETSYTLGTPVEVKTDSTPKTTITFNGLTVGTTYVTIGNVKYTIKVVPEDVNNVEPLSIEYWITNGQVQRSENDTTKSLTVSANMDGIATPDGVEVTANTMIPQDGYRDGRTVDYWQCRLLDTSISNTYGDNTQKQTEQNGDDETTSGVAFTKVRYYGGRWAVYTENNEWVTVEPKHQLVAYFLEIITIDNKNGTRELYVNAADWGNIGSKTGTFGYYQAKLCAVAVQVVYEDGTTNPEKTDIDSIQTKMLVYGLGGTRGLGTMRFTGENGNKIYKITAETGHMTYNANSSYSISKVKYDKNEKDVWNGELSSGVTVSNPTNNLSTDGGKDNLYWSESRNDFILIRVYVKTPATEDSLTVHYMDATTGTASQFYEYSINVVKDTVFHPNFGVTNGILHDNTVENYYGQMQTVQTDLKEMPEIDATYRFAAYECYDTRRSEDGKDVYLYYKFTRNASFVADFGLPIIIPFEQINSDLNSANITSVAVTTQQYGTVTSNITEKTITYTPNKTFGEDIESLNVTFSGRNLTTTADGAISYQVYIYPASNVLYEENFLTQSGESGLNWTKGTPAELGSQQTQKAKANGNVFGYDAAYVPSDTKPVTGELGAWTATGLEFSKMTRALTTEFYGNGFDLIGNCGPTTGRVMIAFTKQGAATPCRVVMVNTRFNDSSVATTLYQVPWAHVELGAVDAMYKVEIFASGNETNSSSRTMLASGYAAETDAFDSILAAYGMSASDVEYINVADTITVPSAYAVSYASVAADVTADQTIEVDGFRVYRSTNNANYPTSEQNVTYKNILKVVKDEITAYTENGNGGAVKVTEYEKKGGPQNEIYLGKNQTVTFRIDGVNEIQVSLRAVSDSVKWNGNNITSNTEMYYTLEKDSNGVFTIANSSDNLLAIGNVKIPGNAGGIQTASELPADVVLASVRMALGASGEGDTFDPAISAKVTTTRFIRSKVVTLTVSASADVEKLMVNGVELRPTNSWLVKMGWSDTYTYILTEKVQKNEIKTYEIVGYRADGAASAPIVVKSK